MFNAKPSDYGIGDWYGETGMMVTTQFFGIKIQRYLHEHDIDPEILGMISEKAFRNGSLNPNVWRRTPIPLEEIMSVRWSGNPL